MKEFPLIGKWTTWRIQRNKVRIREDPYIGCKDNFKLCNLIRDIHLLGIYSRENAATNDGMNA